MMAAAMALLLLADPVPTITDLRVEAADRAWAVRVAVDGLTRAPEIHRDGSDVVLALPAVTAAGLVAPTAPPESGIEAVLIESDPQEVRIRIHLREAFPFQLRGEAGLISVLIRTPPPVARTASDLKALYAKILPSPLPEAGGTPGTEAAATQATTDASTTFHLGFLRIRPSVVVNYVDADSTFLDTPVPVHDRYLQIEPHLGVAGGNVTLPGGAGLSLLYEPRFRASTSFAILRRPTHLATASAALPIGSSLVLKGTYHFAHGLLETTEIDPGREYFFNLAPFTRHDAIVRAAFDPGGPVTLSVIGSHDHLHVEGPGFFDHDLESLQAEARYELHDGANALLTFGLDRVPRPDERPVAEANGRSLTLGVDGDILPLVRGTASIGIRRVDAPLAAAPGRRFQGVIANVRLAKEFTPGTSLGVFASRGTYPSDFEDNAFYVAAGGGLEVNAGLPLSIVGRAGVGWQRNSYKVPSVENGTLRRDDLFGWSVGAGRGLTRWAFVRVDYRREHRTSNLSAFDSRNNAFTMSFGLGYLGSAETAAP
jgi:Putative beta-barrel porin 2